MGKQNWKVSWNFSIEKKTNSDSFILTNFDTLNYTRRWNLEDKTAIQESLEALTKIAEVSVKYVMSLTEPWKASHKIDANWHIKDVFLLCLDK